MSLTRAQKVRLGAFVLAGVGAFVGALVLLAGVAVWERRDRYAVRFEESIGGLEPSAQVKYHGLRVGRVERMHIPEDAPETVEVTLALAQGTVLHEGVSAVLDSSGLTGLKTINLIGGDPHRPRLTPGSRIPTGPSLVHRITGHAEQVAATLDRVLGQLAGWTSDDNRRRVERLLDGVRALTHESARFLAETREPLRHALDGVSRASTVVASLSDEGRQTLRVVREEVQQTLRDVRAPLERVKPEEVAAAVRSFEGAMTSLDDRLSQAEVGRLLSELDRTVQDMGRTMQAVDLAVRAGREDFVSTLSYLRQAAEDVREFSRMIAQDPSVLVRGREGAQ